MNLVEFYRNTQKVVFAAIERLGPGVSLDGSDVEVKTPEVLDDRILTEWLAFNYLEALHFPVEGTYVLYEIGGKLSRHAENDKHILEATGIEKVWDPITKATRGVNFQSIPYLRHDKGEVIVVNAKESSEYYDFTTCAAGEDTAHLLAAGLEELFKPRSGPRIGKQSDREHYVFNVPVNMWLFEELQKVGDNLERKLELLKLVPSTIAPKGVIPGFHLSSDKSRSIILRPLVAKGEVDTYMELYNLDGLISPVLHGAVPSSIAYMRGETAQGDTLTSHALL